VEGPWRHSNLDAGAAMLIPVPAPLGGVVVVGEASIAYLAGGQPAKSVALAATIVRVRRRARPPLGAASVAAHALGCCAGGPASVDMGYSGFRVSQRAGMRACRFRLGAVW